MPFGAGPRRCPGMAFAQHEMRAMVIATLQRVQLAFDPHTQKQMPAERLFVSLRPTPFWVVVTERKHPATLFASVARRQDHLCSMALAVVSRERGESSGTKLAVDRALIINTCVATNFNAIRDGRDYLTRLSSLSLTSCSCLMLSYCRCLSTFGN
eukprot:6185475-Pleurochrysis_carterae.AAC.1